MCAGAGVSKFTLQHIEYADANPAIETLLKLAKYFHVSIDELIK